MYADLDTMKIAAEEFATEVDILNAMLSNEAAKQQCPRCTKGKLALNIRQTLVFAPFIEVRVSVCSECPYPYGFWPDRRRMEYRR
jgi:hypothetical protein